MIATIAPHGPARCADGECGHAVSVRVPCLCPQCNATTAAMVAEYRTKAALEIVDAHSETTQRFGERTFGGFMRDSENTPAYNAAIEVAHNPTRGLGLHGAVGVGKSHLAAAIANACIATGTAARYVSVDDLLTGIKASYDGKKGKTEDAILTAYAKIPVLVLDDYGKEPLTDWAVRTMFALVNRRYENNLPVVVTTNFSPAELAGRKVGKDAEPMTYASTMDRLREMVGSWVEMRGRSRR